MYCRRLRRNALVPTSHRGEFLHRGSARAVAHCGASSLPPLGGPRTQDAFRRPFRRSRSCHPLSVRRTQNRLALTRSPARMSVLVAILAAGESIRMGRPKLCLPWGRTTVLGHILDQWREAGAEKIVVVHAPGEGPVTRDVD